MSQFRDQPSWEPYVREIDAVEKNANGQLFVHLTWHTGDHERLDSATAHSKFPNLLLKYYEGNLRFRDS
ncbi:hypothetical protein R3P38DRAFT_3075753 [Favolaschia claudopus]|uniref:Chromo shadow domain-containing protein n=1 Tax=Favolaschia claudopus TaxID=2862362 RepID=A0AAV9ZX28_9AGAR